MDEKLIAPSSEHSAAAREILARADNIAYLLDLDEDALERAAHEQSFLETSRMLLAAQAVARDLRGLAETVDVARFALRDQVARAIDRHDRQAESDATTERPQLIPASATGHMGRAEGPVRAY